MGTSRQSQGNGRPWRRQAAAVVLCAAVLAGCTDRVQQFYDSKLSLDQPIDWWHQLQGGTIASERPPPPGITDPYPNLATVPAKPVPTDPAVRSGLTAQLAAQRDRARLMAAQDPVVFSAAPTPAAAVPPRAATPTAAPAAGSAPSATATVPAPAPAPAPADSDTSTMVLDAASTPAAPPARAARAAPATPAVSDPTAPAAFRNPPPSSGPVTSAPIPALPTAAPPLPNLPGLPTTEAAPVVARARPAAAFRFEPGSSALPETAATALRDLAARSAGGPIAITAGGDATSKAPAAQGAALPLALRRTGAMSAALIAAGVSSSAIRVEAVASGRDASARLVN